MKVLVSASARFARRPDGSLWTSNASLDYPFWCRYLEVFDAVDLLVRAAPADAVPDASVSGDWVEATGPGVRAVPLPCFVGPAQFVRHLPAVHRAIAHAVEGSEAVMTRIPCILGMEVWRLLEAGRPYGVEVVADPYDVFGADNGVNHPLRPLMHWWWPRTLRRQCAGATAAAYVTREALQRRYPPGPATFSTHFSSIHLDRAQLVDAPRRYRAREPGKRGGRAVRLVTVGSLSQLYKAPDVLIQAVARCVERGLDLELEIVGEGVYRPMLESLVASLGLERRVRFAGQLARGPAVVERLDGADLFVLPSKTEGLPRAMIEAMARALPCIGTAVGGIPELLAEDDLVHPGDVEGLAHKIGQVVKNPARMERMSRRNLERAAEYCEDVLRARRNALYRRVFEQTARWLRGRSVQAA